MPERKELGYANGWKDTPEIVKKCAELATSSTTWL
jgi:hypothetical protein